MSRVYKYVAQQPLFAHAWSQRADKPMRLAICSCDDENRNSVELVRLKNSQQAIVRLDMQAHQYPVTKVQFMPSQNTQNEDIMITSSDSLRIYKILADNNSDRLQASGFLRSEKRRQSPITAFDWCPQELNVVASASFDTLISIWDLNQQQLEVQFSGHDRAVNDMSFMPSEPKVFVTCSTDGTLRLFDRRTLQYSSQVYEAQNPLLRCQFNKIDSNLIAFIESDRNEVGVVDLRKPEQAVYLKKHTKPANAVFWSPAQANILLSCAEDGNCYLWDYKSKPTMGYDCKEPAAACAWSSLDKEWCSVVHDKVLELLHI